MGRSDIDKTIGKNTCFWLAGHVPERAATPIECEKVFGKIEKAGSRKRNYETAGKRLLTPAEAKRIVCELLTLLGGSRSVFMEEITSCVLNRTRHVMSPFAEPYVEASNGDDPDSDDSPEKGARDDDKGSNASGIPGQLFEDERFMRRQLEVVSRKATERIWSSVLKMHGDKVFCLYSLPVFYSGKTNVVMKDLGPTSTVGAQHLKLKELLQAELAFVIRNPDDYRFGPKNAVSIVASGLIGRCAENGHVVPL